MDIDKLIEAIRARVDRGIRLTAIEKEVGMPKNHLSGFLNKKRPFPAKWQRKLIDYLAANKLPQKKVSTTSDLSLPPTNEPKKAPVTGNVPPAGLSRTELLRWHREHTQTLS